MNRISRISFLFILSGFLSVVHAQKIQVCYYNNTFGPKLINPALFSMGTTYKNIDGKCVGVIDDVRQYVPGNFKSACYYTNVNYDGKITIFATMDPNLRLSDPKGYDNSVAKCSGNVSGGTKRISATYNTYGPNPYGMACSW